jgi:hypothetical protein
MTDHQDEVFRACNRHMARLLYNLEQANCPTVFHEEVKSKLMWLRKDLLAIVDKHRMND